MGSKTPFRSGAKHFRSAPTNGHFSIAGMSQMGHVWTAPGWQEESSRAALVGAAMCSAFLRGTRDRSP